ncbi:hypothetical protein HWV62_44454 [Athelia sp. TMB]|nr:hypothetical protein HWV62_44454 [Athelia sp. TMB]
MSDPFHSAGFEAYNNASDFAKLQQQQGLDFFSFHSPSDILAPHPDLFESELDSSLAAFDEVQLQLLTVDSNDAFSYLRSDTPTCGPPSTITVSSESTYDSLSAHSESFYNYPHSPYGQTNYSFPLDLEMDFQRIRVGVDNRSDYGVSATQQTTVDPNSFGALPATPPHSPPTSSPYEHQRSSFSDYGGVRARGHSSASSDYYSQLGFGTNGQNTVSPSNINSGLPMHPPAPRSLRGVEDDSKDDGRKKYRCPACPRGKYSSILPLGSEIDLSFYSFCAGIQSENPHGYP